MYSLNKNKANAFGARHLVPGTVGLHAPRPPKDGPARMVAGNDEMGLSLIEALIAISILALGLILVIEAMARTQQALRISENLVLASQIAEWQVSDSEIELTQYHKLNTSTDRGKEVYPGRQFEWDKSVVPYYHDSIQDETKLNEVKVSIRWKEGPFRKNNLTVSHLLLNREKKI